MGVAKKCGKQEIRVENFPAFIIVDDKGNDFFEQI
ncbi:fumarate hydratase C-terminal domain-containing protein [Gaoshiqia sediminis]|nr:fumarate hydratase C-terminal domain-containing protein [Gaoshiqia sediminis]